MARQDSLLISEMAVMLMPCFSHFWNLENECRPSLTFTTSMV